MKALRLRVELVSGTKRIYPMCEFSNAIVKAMGKRCLNINDIACLTDAFDFEYTGVAHDGLANFGIKRVD
jgi:hypothetical protein